MRARSRICWLPALIAGLAVLMSFALPSPAVAFVDPNEPDDVLAQAKPISTDGTSLELWFEGESVNYHGVDWLRFEGRAGYVYRVVVTRGTVWSLPRPRFHDASGTVLPSESRTYATDAYFVATDDGPVYLELPHTSYGEQGSYFVSVTEGAALSFGLADEYEPDNSIRSAKEIPLDGTIQHRVNGDIDLIRMKVRKGKTYRVDVGWDGGPGYGIRSILETGGVEVIGRELIWPGPKTCYLKASWDGELFIKIDNAGTSDAAPYYVSAREMPCSVIAGTVTNAADGSPIFGARVCVYGAEMGGRHADVSLATTYTEPDGSWSLELSPGYYAASFVDPTGTLFGEYWGGVIPPIDYSAVINLGEETTFTADGRLWPAGTLTGQVLSEEGTPVAGASVAVDYHPARPGPMVAVGTTTTGGDGTFSFSGLDPRRLYRTGVYPLAGLLPSGTVETTLPSGGTGHVQITMKTPGVVTGNVRDGSVGCPLPGVQVELHGYWNFESTGFTAVTDSEGNYRITGVPAGRYRVRFTDTTGPRGTLWYGGYSARYGSLATNVELSRETTGVDLTYLDRWAPSTTTTVSSGWQHGPVSVSLETTDVGWMGATTWVIDPDDAEPRVYDGPITLTENGEHTIRYWSVDGFAADGTRNREATHTLTVRIDNDVPETVLRTNIQGKVLAVPFLIDLQSGDGLSGLHATRWRLGDQVGEGPLIRVDRPGQYQLDYCAVDLAGNHEVTRTVSFEASSSGVIASVIPSATALSTGYRRQYSWPFTGSVHVTPRKRATSVAYDWRNRNIFVGESGGTGGVFRFDWDGTSLPAPFPPGSVWGIVGLGVDATGTLRAACGEGVWGWTREGTWLFDVGTADPKISADVAPDGMMWIALGGNRLQLRTPTTSRDVSLGYGPVDVAVSPFGEGYVAGNDKKVHVYTKTGTPLRSWNLTETPGGIEVDLDGYVYVSLDSGVRKYSCTGTLLDSFQAGLPRRLATDAEANVYLTVEGGEDVIRYVNQGRRPTSVSVTGASLYVGQASTFSGKVKPAYGGVGVRLQYSRDGKSWRNVARTMSGPGGVFTAKTVPTASGMYRAVGGGDSTFAPSTSASRVTRMGSILSLTSTATPSSYGGSARVNVKLTRGDGPALPGRAVVVEAYRSGAWRRVASLKTGASGTCSTKVYSLTGNTKVRARYAGTSTIRGTSAYRTVPVKAYLSKPSLASRCRTGMPIPVAGYLKPHHDAGAGVLLEFYRGNDDGTWRLERSVWAKAADYRGYTKYFASVLLNTPGSYRVRASHSDGSHAPTITGYTYFEVW